MKIDKETGTITINATGVTTLHLPAMYFNPDAETTYREVFNHYRKLMQDIEDGNLSTIILPSDRDIDGNLMFWLDQPQIQLVFPEIKHIESVGDIFVASNLNKQEETQNDDQK